MVNDYTRGILANYMVHLNRAVSEDRCNEWVQDYFDRTGVDEAKPETFPADRAVFSKSTMTVPIEDASLAECADDFHRADGNYTPLETSILNALEVGSLAFRITGERKRTEDFSRIEI